MFETGSSHRRRVSRTALVLAQALFLCVSLLGPAFVSAADPTADPSAPPPPSAEPSTEPSPDPSAAPSPEPSTEPTPDPTSAPTPDPTPAPTPDPTSAPTPTPEIASVPYIVTFASGVDSATQAATVAGVGAVETGSIPVLRMRSILLTPSSADDAVADAARRPQRPPRRRRPRPRGRGDSERHRATPTSGRCPKIGWTSVFGTVTPAGSAVVARARHRRRRLALPTSAGQLVAGDLDPRRRRRTHRPERPRHLRWPGSSPPRPTTARASPASATRASRSCRSPSSAPTASARTATSSRASSGRSITAPTSST